RRGIVVCAGSAHLHRAAPVVRVVPLRAQGADRFVEPRGDVTAHRHDHGLTFHRGSALLPVLHDKRCEALDALLGTDQRLQRYADPVRRRLSAAVRVDYVFDLLLADACAFLVYLELDNAGLVVERPGCTVLNRLTDIVDVRVLAEDMNGVLVVALKGCAGEADEGGVRQRLAHPPRAALDEAVLAAVRLVGHREDVGPFRGYS